MENFLYWPLLVVTGIAAGIINTLAGGGSNLTIPALMVLGMPADLANGTNRVAIVLQCIVGTHGFHREKMLEVSDALRILALMVVGGLAGALVASYTPNLYLKPVMLATILGMTLLILVRPGTVIPAPGTPVKRVADTPNSWAGLLLAGFYGGFVQAGVGFVLIAALAGTLRYDLVRTNALKLL
ncbi:MAG: sulfite exporter TauE/SafE family protein, partial [Gammaproteobacteria bacterium]|nr:sulfite exporter TauE/SafE family protein [Gammaproteobacteria bacterium]